MVMFADNRRAPDGEGLVSLALCQQERYLLERALQHSCGDESSTFDYSVVVRFKL